MRRAFVLVAVSLIVGCSSGGVDDAATPTTTIDKVTTVPSTAPASTVATAPTVPTAPENTLAASTPTTIPEGGGTATGALEDADVQIETEEGTIQIGVAEVPVGVSDTFPLPADLDVQLSSATETDFGFSGVSTMTVADLTEFYDAAMVEAGYTITERQVVEGVVAVYTFERADEQGQVAISTEPGGLGSSVLVTIGDGTTVTEATFDG